MSESAAGAPLDDLVARLAALLDEARASGRASELVPALEAFLADARSAPRAAPGGGVPLRCGMVGASAAMQRVFDLLERVARSSVPVLVLGETGTGKELVARALHDLSPRKHKRFLAENCAAVPATLLESELFGHKRGSFTGAIADRPGHFVAADGGTLFLDEIGDMPLEMQSKLLRVLESGEVRPVGASSTQKVDVRVVAATHRDLAVMVKERAFREDLYYRLNVVKIELPALRDRREDIADLVRFFLRKVAEESGESPRAIAPEALALLERAPWPGNVRQLENELRRAVALSSGALGVAELSPALGKAP